MKQGIECTKDAIDAALREDGRFELLKLLGKGSFGCVCQARCLESQEIVAIKLLPRSEVNKYVETEIVNHSLMRHPHIIQFKDVFVTSKNIGIVLEYAGTGMLHAYVRRFGHLKESVARWFFQQLTVAVDYCHKKGVANRDIKLENTLLHTVPHLPLPLLKICDFGYSKEENKSAAKSKVGTLTYMAPEVLLNVTGQTRYDGKVADIWSCGVMLFVMLTGRYPFDSPNTKGVIASPQDFILMLEQMVGCRYEIPASLDLSEDCKDLLRRMLLPEPHRRITTEQILEHPWFNTNLPPEAATMNDRCLLLAPMPGVPQPDEVRSRLAAYSTERGGAGSLFATSSSGTMSGSAKGGGGSRESSGTRAMVASGPASDAPYGTQQVQQHVHAELPNQYVHVQQHPQQHPQQHQQQHMQMQYQPQQVQQAALIWHQQNQQYQQQLQMQQQQQQAAGVYLQPLNGYQQQQQQPPPHYYGQR